MLIIEENPIVEVKVTLPKNAQGETPNAVFLCRVMDDDTLPEALEERFAMLITDWRDVVDSKGNTLKFSPKILSDILKQPGFIGHFHQSYHQARIWGAEKNFGDSSEPC